MDCPFCLEPIEEGDGVADTQYGEARTDADDEFVGEIDYGSVAETGHVKCYERAIELFQEKGGA